jgi:GH18 family chitinase
MVARIAHLKVLHPGLRVNIAVGGWAFNDYPTQTRFSDMVSSKENRNKFITSTFRFLSKYGLDGIDIDWEYPEADDRGGVSADYKNYVALLQDFRDRMNSDRPQYELTITIPASYWYLRHFDIKAMEPLVDWFNLMSYDIHGKWDQGNIWTGAFLKGHTNITEIDEALDLLWRNSIKPEKVVMGFGFYGRSFTMADPDCSEPSCAFIGAGRPGACTDTEGILTYSEVHSRNYTLNSLEFHYDPVSTVKYEIYDGNQWISYDDAQSFNDKKKFLTERCLGGLMIWAIDQDTVQYDALAGLLGDDAVQGGLIKGGNLSDEAKADLVDVYAQFTGQECYVTPGCTDETSSTMGSRQRCKAGFTAVERAHNPRTQQSGEKIDTCDTGYWHQVCCPTEHLPQHCEWSNPVRAASVDTVNDDFCQIGVRAFAGSRVHDECPFGKFLLSEDTARNKEGTVNCVPSTRRGLCCESNVFFEQCRWTECGVSCNEHERVQTTRRSDRYGTICDYSRSPPDLNIIASFCCPNSFAGYSNCEWSQESDVPGNPGNCVAKSCPPTKLKITHALVPPDLREDCGARLPTNDAGEFSYCCDPSPTYTHDLPVDPAKLWTDPHYQDVEWSYSDEYTNNDKDPEFSGQQAYGDDAYGFIMMDGPTDMISHSFERDFTVIHDDPSLPARKSKRSIITRDSSILDATFDHKEEVVMVYCNYGHGSPECEGIHENGAIDTIIKLPTYVGEGPFGRVVSFQIAENHKLPAHHIQSRAIKQNTNPIWELKFDYNFNMIKRESASGKTVNMRIDYTNLLPYWDEMTDSDPNKRKRSADMPPPPRPGSPGFQDLLRRSEKLKKDHNKTLKSTVDFSDGFATRLSTAPSPHDVEKRWFGTFIRWLQKMTTVESKDKGDLNMMYSKSLLIYSARVGCEKSTLQAGLDIHADASLNLNAQYAYYLSGTIVPPSVDDTFAYFGVQPQAYLGVRMNGNAALRYTSARKKLIETLSYPGLSIRGLAAVGPTLDLYGQLAGNVKLAGQIQVGAKYNFPRSEGYWPRNSDSATYEKIFGDSDTISTQGSGLEPRLSASVQAEANFDVLITPEANMGISAFGIVDAQVTAFVNNTLRFHIEGSASGDNTNGVSTSFDYGVYYLWNIGLNSHGSFSPKAFGIGWNSPTLLLFPNGAKEVKLYPQSGSSKRSYMPDIELPELSSAPRRGMLNPPRNQSMPSLGFKYMEMENVDIWGNESATSELRKRLDADDIANFARGLISCPDTTMCNGPGSVSHGSGSCRHSSRALRLQDDSDDGNGDGSDAGTCSQDGSDSGIETCTDQQPRLMYNCRYFPDQEIEGDDLKNNANEVTVPSICRNVRNAMRAESVDNDYQLVYEPRNSRQRRRDSCPPGFCAPINEALTDGLGQGYDLVSCDEFPFASSEEGGRLSGIKVSLPQPSMFENR